MEMYIYIYCVYVVFVYIHTVYIHTILVLQAPKVSRVPSIDSRGSNKNAVFQARNLLASRDLFSGAYASFRGVVFFFFFRKSSFFAHERY